MFDNTASKADINKWLNCSKDIGYVLIVSDRFDYSDYPIYCKNWRDLIIAVFKYDGKKMQKIMEVYDLTKNITEQLNAYRTGLDIVIKARIELKEFFPRKIDLREAVLSNMDLQGIDLCKKDLRGVDLSGSNLKGSSLCKTNLEGANLSFAKLDGANFEGALLDGSNFSNSTYSKKTQWPLGFDPDTVGAKLIEN